MYVIVPQWTNLSGALGEDTYEYFFSCYLQIKLLELQVMQSIRNSNNKTCAS